jgi:hypothetical protein
MAQVGPGAGTSARVVSPTGVNFVEWGPIIAGAVTAAALSFVLLTFGSAIGLSATSPWPGSGVSAKTFSSLAVFWTMVQQIGAFMAGAYVAGRMRTRWNGTDQDEVEFRDGLHGALVWAVGVAVGAALFVSAAGGITKAGADLAGKTAVAAAATNSDPMAYFTDALVRPMPRATATGTGTGTATTTTAARAEPMSTESKAEISRIMARAVANGSLVETDKSYLAMVVAQRTGMSQTEAEKRVADTFAEANRASREAADKARRAAVLTGFVTAASLLISLAAAWWAAQRGGHHRDNAIPARFAFSPPPRRTT